MIVENSTQQKGGFQQKTAVEDGVPGGEKRFQLGNMLMCPAIKPCSQARKETEQYHYPIKPQCTRYAFLRLHSQGWRPFWTCHESTSSLNEFQALSTKGLHKAETEYIERTARERPQENFGSTEKRSACFSTRHMLHFPAPGDLIIALFFLPESHRKQCRVMLPFFVHSVSSLHPE